MARREEIDPYQVFDATGSFSAKPIKQKRSRKRENANIKSILAHW
jgi:hypothetical protein